MAFKNNTSVYLFNLLKKRQKHIEVYFKKTHNFYLVIKINKQYNVVDQ